jgi:hypothetical protein
LNSEISTTQNRENALEKSINEQTGLKTTIINNAQEDEPKSQSKIQQQSIPKQRHINYSNEEQQVILNRQSSNQQQRTNNKTTELRQKEIRLRKREEEMKIREKALQDNNERTVRLESYIKNLELEKAEYENTIRALKRKIVNLEDTKSYTAKEEVTCTSSNSTTYDTNNQSLLQDIHKKVTNYILKQVDIQIQKLDVDENNQRWIRNKQNNEDRKENNQDLEQKNQEQQRRNHNEIVNNSNNHRNNPYNDQQTVVMIPHNRLPFYLHGQNLIQAPVHIPQNMSQANNYETFQKPYHASRSDIMTENRHQTPPTYESTYKNSSNISRRSNAQSNQQNMFQSHRRNEQILQTTEKYWKKQHRKD